MSSVLSTVLITAPIAFLVGWLLSKAVFNHLSVTRPNPGVAPAQAAATATTATTSSSAAAPALEDPADIRQKHNDIQLLKEAVAERDHQIENLKQKLAAKPEPLEDTSANAAAQENKLRETVKALREGLATKEKHLVQLQNALQAAKEKSTTNKRLLKSGRTRIKALAKQFRQQKLIISELREELKQRELHQRELDARRQQQQAAPPAQPPEVVASSGGELRALQGVGPAMQTKLHEQGIYRLKQLAEMDSTALLALANALSINPARMAKIDWPSQARKLLGEPAAVSQPPAEREPALAG